MSATPQELRIAIAGIVYGAQDAKGTNTYSEDSWATTTDNTASIFEVDAELE